MKRIFYYSGFRLTVFHWLGEKCIATYAFNPDEEGLKKFKSYLLATHNTPARILVDLIEEDFKQENIPHVGTTDRKSIVTRLIERQHRNSIDYFYYHVMGREKTGRKDDILLYSVLSNPQILEPWLNTMAKCNTSISGIWSLPLLSEKLFNKLNYKVDNVLLVSQQVPSNLRQTFLKKSKFQSSRSAVVNLEDASIGEHISLEVEQTIRFLSNQRHLGFDEKIEIHIICRQQDIAEIKTYCENTTLRSFHYHPIDEILKQLECTIQLENEPFEIEYSNGIYSYICSEISIPIGHYGNRNIFTHFYRQIISKTLYATSIFSMLATLILAFYFTSESFLFDKETLTLKIQTQGVIKLYQKKLAKLQHKLSQTQVMKSSVLLVEEIKKNKHVSPQNFMTDISRVLTRSGMRDTEITGITWQHHQSEMLPGMIHNQNKKHTDYADHAKINHHVILNGYIRVSNSSLKESVDKVNAIADACKHHQFIHHVKINRMPVDVRSKSSIENVSGVENSNNASQDKQKGQFEIELLLQSNKP